MRVHECKLIMPEWAILLTKLARTGRKRVVVATLEMTSVTTATITVTASTTTGRARCCRPRSCSPIQQDRPDFCKRQTPVRIMGVGIFVTLTDTLHYLGPISYGKSRAKDQDNIPWKFVLHWIPIQQCRIALQGAAWCKMCHIKLSCILVPQHNYWPHLTLFWKKCNKIWMLQIIRRRQTMQCLSQRSSCGERTTWAINNIFAEERERERKTHLLSFSPVWNTAPHPGMNLGSLQRRANSMKQQRTAISANDLQ